ncbi:MAG TPA: hypothetical protein VF559_00390 [Caulobacteraceae bacterium]|jgi:hypothetical protein
MSDLINRIMIGFLAAFAAACVGIIVYQVFWAAPAARCEKSGGWWDPGRRECGKVIYIPEITGRYVDAAGRERRVRMPTQEQLARERAGSRGPAPTESR